MRSTVKIAGSLVTIVMPVVLAFSCSTMNPTEESADQSPVKFGVSAQEAEERLSKLPKFLTEGPLFSSAVVEPTMLFDNVAFVGYKGVGAFVVNTSDGIILIDTMWNPNDAQNVIVPGIKKLGLDPEKIKYVVITHGHDDHFGGAQYFEQMYGAKIFMSQSDWDEIHDPNTHAMLDPFGNFSNELPLPSAFIPVEDGQELTLGDTTLTLLSTPGHTHGGISLIVPVTDNGVPHTAAIWGGTGLPQTLEENKTYLNSLNYFASVAIAANVDTDLPHHPFVNGFLAKINALGTRQANEPNPVIMGTEAYKNYIDMTLRKAVTDKITAF